MNSPLDSAPLLGKLARNSLGHVGIIYGHTKLSWGDSYIGLSLDGYPWSARTPEIIADADDFDYLQAISAAAAHMLDAGLLRSVAEGAFIAPTTPTAPESV